MIRLLFLSVILSVPSLAQHQIKGRVTDTDSNSLEGVYIVVKGRIRGTVTDLNGYFNYTLPEKSHFIFFYKNGFYNHVLKIKQDTTLIVKLKSNERRQEQWWVSPHDTIPSRKKSNNDGSVLFYLQHMIIETIFIKKDEMGFFW